MKWKTIVDINRVLKYAVHILRPQNIESVEPELKNIGDKSQDNNEIVLHNNIINARLN